MSVKILHCADLHLDSPFSLSGEEKIEQETRSLKGIDDSFKKIIIVEKSMKPRYDENGYLMMGIKEFLLNTDSLLA